MIPRHWGDYCTFCPPAKSNIPGRITGIKQRQDVGNTEQKTVRPASHNPVPIPLKHGTSASGPRSIAGTNRPTFMNTMIHPTHEEIARRAKHLWQDRGCPQGQDERIWLEAEKQLTSESLDESRPSSGVSAERVKAETAAESMVEYQITPAVSQDEAIKAALQKKEARTANPPAAPAAKKTPRRNR
jgi:hypothetical protein